jgi:hypothetical protein
MASAIVVLALLLQPLALFVRGHRAYLWVQSIEALVAAALLSVYGLRYRTHDPRASRWPPLLPLAAVALFGAIKNFYVIGSPETPLWAVVCLLASVGWFAVESFLIWRVKAQP